MEARRHKSGLSRTVWIAVAAAALALSFPQPGKASKSLFTDTGTICTQAAHCWQAGDFGVLVGLYNATTTTWTTGSATSNNSTINGEIGVGSGSTITYTGNQNRTWEGPIDFADALNSSSGTCGAGSCSAPSGNTLTSGNGKKVTVTNGTAREATEIQTAMDQIRQISAYWASYSGTVTSLGTTLGTSVTSLGAAGQTRVYSATTVNTTNNLTITGDANSLVIVNITGSSTTSTIPVQFTNNITLSGGITSDQVFFNILGTSTGSGAYVMQAATSGRILNGVFYVAADSYNVSTQFGGTSTGDGARLFGGVGANTWGANFTLNDPPDTPLPEPSTYLLLAAGLGAIAYHKRSRPRT